MRRFLVFLLYDPDGFVDNAVLHTLAGLRDHVEHIFVVVNGFLQEESRDRLTPFADEIFERENVGFDIGAYRAALGRIGAAKLAEYDELMFVNYTFFGPITTFDALFERMDETAVDFWGMTNHVAVTPHPMVGKGTMPEHLQSYWLTLRKSLFTSSDFKEYWARIPDAHSYVEVVTVFETEFTKHFADLGYTWETAYPNDEYGVWNVSMEAPLGLLERDCPMFKRRIFFHDVVDIDHRGVSAAEIAAKAIELGFPRDVLVEGIIRRTPVRSLATGLGLLVIQPDDVDSDPISGMSVKVRDGRFWTEWLRDGDSPFTDADIVIVSAPEPGYGELNDSHLGRYRRATREIVERPNATSAAFASDAKLGLIVPLTEHRGTDRLAYGWQGHEKRVGELAKLLGLRGPLEVHSPLTPVMGIAAYRREAFADLPERIRKAGGWHQLATRYGGDGVLADLLDLLAADVAKTLDYLTAEATTPSQHQVSHAILAEKFAAVSARFDPGPHSPFMERLKQPSLVWRAKLGEVVRGRSPAAAKALVAGERVAKRTLRPVVAVLRRVLKRGR